MKTININGTDYVRLDKVLASPDCDHVCVIADNGWIFEGKRDLNRDLCGDIELLDAHVVRKWSNGLGIGGLADPAHKDDYTLDKLGEVNVYREKIVAVFPLEW